MQSSNPQRSELYRDAIRAAALGLIVNLVLGVTKLTAGLVVASFALISDAVNSLGDALTSCVVLFALIVAQRPPDTEHPYGHTRAEAIAASNVALLIMISAGLVGWEAVQRISVVHAAPPVWTLWIAGVNVVIKECLYHYKRRVGARTGSAVIMANAWDHRCDALSSLAVLAGLATVRLAGPDFIWADEAAALVVVGLILLTSLQLFRSSVSELMDRQADADFVARIETAARTVAEVQEVETLWVRKSGLEYFADIHIQVDAQLTVDEGHRIGHRVKDRLLEQFPMLRDVLVHLEPWPRTHEARSERLGHSADQPKVGCEVESVEVLDDPKTGRQEAGASVRQPQPKTG